MLVTNTYLLTIAAPLETIDIHSLIHYLRYHTIAKTTKMYRLLTISTPIDIITNKEHNALCKTRCHSQHVSIDDLKTHCQYQYIATCLMQNILTYNTRHLSIGYLKTFLTLPTNRSMPYIAMKHFANTNYLSIGYLNKYSHYQYRSDMIHAIRIPIAITYRLAT